MNNEIVTSVLNVIQRSTDRAVTLKALIKLRADLVKDREGIVLFRKCGGIPPLIPLLSKPHEKILETGLSILANCCTDRECCEQALQNKIVPPLVAVLKGIPNPVIQCRASRLLGNLAKEFKTQVLNQHNSAIAQALCLILEETPDLQARLMAVRAARYLLTDDLFLRNFVKADGFKIMMKILAELMKNSEAAKDAGKDEVPQPVGLKVNQHREKYFEEVARHLEGVRSDIFDNGFLKDQQKSYEFVMPQEKPVMDLCHEILKCVQIISESPTSFPIYELYSATVRLPCIVFLADEISTFRSIALKIISNFSKRISAISALSSAGAIGAACELLTKKDLENPLSESETRHCINIVCMLSGDACNRAKIRRSGSLGKLLEIAKSSESQSEVSLILFALNNFQYDSMSMDLMLREGLVGLLIKELNLYLNSTDEYRKKKCDEKKRMSKKRKSEIFIQSNSKAPRILDDFFESPNSSPTGSTSPSSPCSSRSMSPSTSTRHLYAMADDNDSETYSPVCSEDEAGDDDEDSKSNENEFLILKLLDTAPKAEPVEDGISDDDETSQGESDNPRIKKPFEFGAPQMGNLPNSALDIIENLLFRVTLLVQKRGELGKIETLQTIIQAINAFGINNNFCSSLTNILSESQFFAPIIKQGIIHQLYKMTQVDELKVGGINLIDTLTCVAECGYGRGELTRLLKADQSSQKRAAIAVSFIVKTPKLLMTYMTEGGSLYIVLNTILNKDDEYRIEAADAMTSMANSLGIRLPKNEASDSRYDQEFDEATVFPLHCDTDEEMRFIIHRGCSQIPIKFSKKLLTDNSEVFNSMLNSSFREGKEGEIHLKDYTVNGIKYFLNLVDLVSKKQTPNIPPVYHFDSILEAYELARIYIMHDLEKILFGMLVHRMDATNCLRVLEWSLKNFNPELSEISINYYLCSPLPGLTKVELFRKADYSDLSKEWNQMIIDAILVKCQNLCVDGGAM